MLFEIQCGAVSGTVEAETIGEAWRAKTKKVRTGFAALARFREHRPTGKLGPWLYIAPAALDTTP